MNPTKDRERGRKKKEKEEEEKEKKKDAFHVNKFYIINEQSGGGLVIWMFSEMYKKPCQLCNGIFFFILFFSSSLITYTGLTRFNLWISYIIISNIFLTLGLKNEVLWTKFVLLCVIKKKERFQFNCKGLKLKYLVVEVNSFEW